MKFINIYFAGSIRGGREKVSDYRQIIAFLKTFGEVLTEHVGESNLTENGESLDDQEIYERDIRLIRQSCLMIAEVTQPSMGVGYEIAYAESLRIPVIALMQEESHNILSAMIRGNPRISVIYYKDMEHLKAEIETWCSVFGIR